MHFATFIIHLYTRNFTRAVNLGRELIALDAIRVMNASRLAQPML